MKRTSTRIAVAFLCLVADFANAQVTADIPASEYARLLKASRFVENFKETAALSARVFGARGQGNDKDFARFMGDIASADLSDATPCLVNVLGRQNLTQQDIDYLVATFESPLGAKFLQQSQRMLLASIEQGAPAPPPPDTFSENEKRSIVEIQQNASFRKYGQITSNPKSASDMMMCMALSTGVPKTGARP